MFQKVLVANRGEIAVRVIRALREEVLETSRAVGFPVLLKAAAGGGGKGMRLVESEADLEAAFRDAASEAEGAFGNGAVYVERAVTMARHIEIQVLGDQDGHMVHFGERECSIQRRHQKVIEECPSPLMTSRPELRQQMEEAALRVVPNGGESWTIRSSRTIQWSSNTGGNVKIELSRDGGTTWSTLVASTPNDGSYNWTVTRPSSANCRLRVTSTTVPGATGTSNANFTIL